MPSVLVTCPNTGWIHKAVVFKLIHILQDRRHKTTLLLPTHRPFENNLHHIINDFVAGDYDYWLTIDNDNPPQNNPLDLVELDRDIVGLPTPVWNSATPGGRPIYWNAYKYDAQAEAYREWPDKRGLQKVDAVGTGCVLFARRVFEDPDMQNGAFTRKLNLDGTVDRGNDISFCERARERGWNIWAHFGYPCDHICELPMIEVIEAFN